MFVLPTSTRAGVAQAARRRARRRARRSSSSIREPQVVRRPCGHQHVLVRDRNAGQRRRVAARERGVGRARLRRARRRASTVMNALSAACASRCARAACCVSSTLESASRAQRGRELGDRCRRSSASRRYSITFGTRYSPSSTAGATLLVSRAPVGLGDDVVAQRQHHVLRMRHRLDAGRVDRLQLVDQREDRVELRARRRAPRRRRSRCARDARGAGCRRVRGPWCEAVGSTGASTSRNGRAKRIRRRATALRTGRAAGCGKNRVKSVRKKSSLGYHSRHFLPRSRARSQRACSRGAKTSRAPSLHVRFLQRLLLQRSRDRPRHRQHADLRARQGHRARTSPRSSRSARKAARTARR